MLMRLRLRTKSAPTLAGSTGMTAMSALGRSWQARRIDGLADAPTRASTKASRPDGGGNAARSLTTRTRHVEHRALPPQTLACGTLNRMLVSRMVRPRGVRTFLPGYDTVIDPRWFSTRARPPRATNPSRIAAP